MKLPKLPRIVYIGLAGICVYFAIKFGGPPPIDPATSICKAADKLERISCSEKIILVPPGGGRNRRNKIDGFAAIKNRDFNKAIALLQQDWNANHDPEVLIAIQNAQILRDRPQTVKTIAAVIPSQGAPIYVAEGILKGIAEAQREWNQTSGSYKLLVAIADDRNEPADAKQIAEELAKHHDLLAVLGHYSSNVTTQVKDIYDRAHLTLVSATSTSDELTVKPDDLHSNYFFRVTNTTTISADSLAKKWAAKPDKIALFYTPGKKFSESFRTAFVAKIPPGNIVSKFLLSERTDAAQELAKAGAAGAKTIVLIPDAYTDENERDRVLSVIKANQGQMRILGNSIVGDAYLFQVKLAYLKNLIISTPVHPSDPRIDRARLSKAPDWWGTKAQIQERIIYSYDAMQVLLAALDRSTDSQTVRQTISAPGFSVRGITGKISFNGSDRAQKIDSSITPSSCDDRKCNFELAK